MSHRSECSHSLDVNSMTIYACMQGMTHGVRTIIKTYNKDNENAMEAYQAELMAYKNLTTLQGKYIPRLLYYGPVQDSLDPTLVLEHCGVSLEDMPSLTLNHKRGAMTALRAMHKAGASHGYVDLKNLVLHPTEKHVMLIDLAYVTFPTRGNLQVTLFKDEKRHLKAELENAASQG